MAKRLALFAFSVLVFAVSAELISLVVYYYQTGHLFYTFRNTYALIPETKARALTSVGLHPYFGPTHKAGLPFDIPAALKSTSGNGAGTATNNFGFVSRHDYPFVKQRDDQFVIGLFGGSVGLWFCEVGAERLVQDLRKNSFFRSRELIPLCLSHEGYKQPQQLILLAYFLSIGQRFDLVINIDGFNEVALASLNNQNGLDISMPSFMHIDPLINLVNQSTLTPEKLQSLAEISRYKEKMNSLADRINRNGLAAVNLVLEQSYKILSNRYRSELATLARLPSNPSAASLIQVTPKVKDRDGATLFKDIAANWMDSSMLMNTLLAARGVPYLHFLQPNQYYTTRPFGDAEAAVALNNGSPFRENAAKGYPFLVAEAEARGAGLNFFNAIGIFDREPSPVYMDDCCHYTLVGNQILADTIAARVLASQGPWRE